MAKSPWTEPYPFGVPGDTMTEEEAEQALKIMGVDRAEKEDWTAGAYHTIKMTTARPWTEPYPPSALTGTVMPRLGEYYIGSDGTIHKEGEVHPTTQKVKEVIEKINVGTPTYTIQPGTLLKWNAGQGPVKGTVHWVHSQTPAATVTGTPEEWITPVQRSACFKVLLFLTSNKFQGWDWEDGVHRLFTEMEVYVKEAWGNRLAVAWNQLLSFSGLTDEEAKAFEPRAFYRYLYERGDV